MLRSGILSEGFTDYNFLAYDYADWGMVSPIGLKILRVMRTLEFFSLQKTLLMLLLGDLAADLMLSQLAILRASLNRSEKRVGLLNELLPCAENAGLR